MDQPSQQSQCVFCENGNNEGISTMMVQALRAKHSGSQSQALIGYIDVIMNLEEPCSSDEAWAVHQYKEYLIADQQEQFLKREYTGNEYQGKLTMLSEYYKFHSDIPRVVEPGIEKILNKYYDKKRQYDYKKIKKLLKEEQGLSITSVQQSQSSFGGDSIAEKKSRYSTLLDILDDQEPKNKEDALMSDSKLLKEVCKQIDRALPSTEHDGTFQVKGAFSNEKIFEQYLRKEEQRLKVKLRQRNRERLGINRVSKKVNLQDLLKKRRENRQKQTIQRDSKDLKKKQKEGKFIYNTNIKIQIKNAMFYSNGQQPLQLGNVQYQSGNRQDPRFRKKNLIHQVNFLKDNIKSSSKLLTDIYKTVQDPRIKNTNNPLSNSKQRLTTKESVNRSQSKNKKKSLTKQPLSNQLKKGLTGSYSARKLTYNNGMNQWTKINTNSNNRLPVKSVSSSNLKKRSISLNGGLVSSSSSKRIQRPLQKRPIQTISRYGSSDMKGNNVEIVGKGQRTISIKDILTRKLAINRL